MDPELDPLRRIEYAFYAMFVAEAWYTHLKEVDMDAKEAMRIAIGIEKARICSEEGISAKAYNEMIKEERKKKKEEEKKKKEARKAEEKKRKAEEKDKKKKEKKAKAREAKRTKNATASALSISSIAPSAPIRSAPPTLSAPSVLPSSASSAPSGKRSTVAQQFITRTGAAGIAFNAWFLLSYVCTLISNDKLRKAVPFTTRVLTEQEAEKIFRAIRGVLGGENFTLTDFMRRCDHFTAHSILRALHEGVDFFYAAHDKAFRWDEILKCDKDAQPLPDDVTLSRVIVAIRDAKLACIADMLAINIDINSFKSVRHLDVDGHLEELEKDDDDLAISASAAAAQAPSEADATAQQEQIRAEMEAIAEVRNPLYVRSICAD